MSGVIHTAVVGVAEYRLNTEETDVLDARRITSDAVEKDCTICQGRATADTSDGFPGDYHIQYFDSYPAVRRGGNLYAKLLPVLSTAEGQEFLSTWNARIIGLEDQYN